MREKETLIGELTVTKQKLDRVSPMASIQLYNVYVHKESLRHSVLIVGQVACRITADEEGRRLLPVGKKRIFLITWLSAN